MTTTLFATEQKEHKFSICAVFKNEDKYLKEWLEYHRGIGVDHFYLYNIESKDAFENILEPYIESDIVTLVNWPEIASQQPNSQFTALIEKVPAYENAVHFLAKEETEWLTFLDINEYLVCIDGNLQDLLNRYEGFTALSLISDTFDEENSINNSKQLENNNTSIKKMFFKPAACEGFLYPPYQCRFKNNEEAVKTDYREVRIKCFANNKINSKKNTKTLTSINWLLKNVNKKNKPMYSRPLKFLADIKNSL